MFVFQNLVSAVAITIIVMAFEAIIVAIVYNFVNIVVRITIIVNLSK